MILEDPPPVCPPLYSEPIWLQVITIVALIVFSSVLFVFLMRQVYFASERAADKTQANRASLKAAGLVALVQVPIVSANLVEGRDLFALLDTSRQSLAAMFGDPLLGPAMAYLIVRIWYRLSFRLGWFNSYFTFAGVGLGAIALTWWFRANDARVYDDRRFYAADKLAHDFVNVTVIGVVLILALLTILAALLPGSNKTTKWMGSGLAVLFAVFAYLLYDSSSGLDPSWLHQPVSWTSGLPKLCRVA